MTVWLKLSWWEAIDTNSNDMKVWKKRTIHKSLFLAGEQTIHNIQWRYLHVELEGHPRHVDLIWPVWKLPQPITITMMTLHHNTLRMWTHYILSTWLHAFSILLNWISKRCFNWLRFRTWLWIQAKMWEYYYNIMS